MKISVAANSKVGGDQYYCWVLASIENPDYPTKITPSRAMLKKLLPSNKENPLDWTTCNLQSTREDM